MKTVSVKSLCMQPWLAADWSQPNFTIRQLQLADMISSSAHNSEVATALRLHRRDLIHPRSLTRMQIDAGPREIAQLTCSFFREGAAQARVNQLCKGHPALEIQRCPLFKWQFLLRVPVKTSLCICWRQYAMIPIGILNWGSSSQVLSFSNCKMIIPRWYTQVLFQLAW